MTDLAPKVFLVTAGATGADNLMPALYTHFKDNSFYFNATVTATPASGFLITPKDVTETWQACLTRTTGDGILVSIDPDSAITNPALPAASASAAWSGVSGTASMSFLTTYSNKCYVVELPDAAFVFALNSTDVFSPSAIHFGRVLIPFFKSDPGDGLDGLGFLARIPNFTTGGVTTSNIWASTASADGTNGNRMRVGPTTWELTQAALSAYGGSAAAGRVQSIPVVLRLGGNNRPLGFLKYAFMHGTSYPSKTRIQAATGQMMLFMSSATGTTSLNIPWESSVIPI